MVTHQPTLSGNDHGVASSGDRLPYEGLAASVPVDIGRVDEGDAKFERPMDGAKRLGIVDVAPRISAYGPRAKADFGYLDLCVAECR